MSDDFDAIVGDIDDELDLTLYADAAELAEEVTVQILAAIEKGLKLKSQFHLVLTGGTLGVQISEALVNEFNADSDGFAGLHIWWSDERFVPADSVERNAFPFHKTVTNTKIVVHEALASDVAKSIDEAVSDYDLALENVDIDLNVLGLGEEDHVPGKAVDGLRHRAPLQDQVGEAEPLGPKGGAKPHGTRAHHEDVHHGPEFTATDGPPPWGGSQGPRRLGRVLGPPGLKLEKPQTRLPVLDSIR